MAQNSRLWLGPTQVNYQVPREEVYQCQLVKMFSWARCPDIHPDLVNLYDCVIGDETRIGAFVEIQVGAKIGSRCKISSDTFICEGVTIEDEVSWSGVMFFNDKFPRATTNDGKLQGPADWKVEPTRICRRASIGSNATILCGLTIGEGATIGAGAL